MLLFWTCAGRYFDHVQAYDRTLLLSHMWEEFDWPLPRELTEGSMFVHSTVAQTELIVWKRREPTPYWHREGIIPFDLSRVLIVRVSMSDSTLLLEHFELSYVDKVDRSDGT